MSGLPDYIPAKAPAQTVTDLSGTLSVDQLGRLDNLGNNLSFKPRVVIMPKSYQAQDDEAIHSLAKDIAAAWKVQGNRLLMVVDLSGRKVRIIAGSDLTGKGVTNEYIKRTILPNYFYPAVRKGNIEGALNNSLRAIQQREMAYGDGSRNIAGGTSAGPTGPIYRALVANSQSADASSMISPSSSALPGAQHDWSGIACFAGIFVVAAVGLYFIINKSNQDKSNRLSKALNERLAKLYKTADELGQASEYIAPQTNKDLALKVSAFFEKLQALDKAKDEIEKFSASRRWGKANDGLLPALKLVDKLNGDGEDLLEKVSAITGGVDSIKPDESEKKAIAKKSADSSDESHKIKINMPANQSYQRPSWTYDQQYSQPVYINSGSSSGIMDVLFLVNEMDNSRRLSNLENNQWSGAHNSLFNNSNNSGSNNNDNNSWSNDGGTDSGGSWDSSSNSSSSSFSSDSGGSWDSPSDSSSSSDSGGSDSGGSW